MLCPRATGRLNERGKLHRGQGSVWRSQREKKHTLKKEKNLANVRNVLYWWQIDKSLEKKSVFPFSVCLVGINFKLPQLMSCWA